MIHRIEALNFRSLRYISQEVGQFQVLVGPNASGKSTFLDVVALLGDFVRSGLDEALLFGRNSGPGRARSLDELIFNQIADGFELAVEFTVPAGIRAAKNGNSNAGADLARYEVAFGKGPQGELEIKAEILWLIDSAKAGKPPRQNQLPLFPTEPSPPKTIMTTGKTPSGWQTVAKKVPQSGNDYYKSESGQWNIQYRVGDRTAALSGLPTIRVAFPWLFGYATCSWTASRCWRSTVQPCAVRSVRRPPDLFMWRGRIFPSSFRISNGLIPCTIGIGSPTSAQSYPIIEM